MKKYILFRSLIIYPYNLTKVNDFIQCCIKCFKNMKNPIYKIKFEKNLNE